MWRITDRSSWAVVGASKQMTFAATSASGHFRSPWEVTPSPEVTGMMVLARVAKPPQARRSPFKPAAGEEKFLGQKALFIGTGVAH